MMRIISDGTRVVGVPLEAFRIGHMCLFIQYDYHAVISLLRHEWYLDFSFPTKRKILGLTKRAEGGINKCKWTKKQCER